MSDVTQEQVIAYITNLKLGDVSTLIELLEDTLGVTAQPGVPIVAAAYGVPDIDDIEPYVFDVVLSGYTGKKLDVIKAVRKETGLGLREAKALVEQAPSVVREAVDRDTAEALRDVLAAVGGDVVLR